MPRCDPRGILASFMCVFVMCVNEILLVVFCLRRCNAGERWLRDHPEASAKMMDLLTGVVIDYMAAQVRSLKSIMPMGAVLPSES